MQLWVQQSSSLIGVGEFRYNQNIIFSHLSQLRKVEYKRYSNLKLFNRAGIAGYADGGPSHLITKAIILLKFALICNIININSKIHGSLAKHFSALNPLTHRLLPIAHSPSQKAWFSAQTGSLTIIVVICASGSKGTSIERILFSARFSKIQAVSFCVFSCAFTPGKSTNQPIHQPSDLFMTALNFISTS